MTPPHNGIAVLLELLAKRRPLLLAGAGASAVVGYPLWEPLIKSLAADFAPGVTLSPDVRLAADQIADAALAHGRQRFEEYLKRLDLTFRREGRRTGDLRFHKRLVSLGFCGLITTNYDPTLEDSCLAEFTRPGATPHICEPIDLRNRRPYLVFEFLRSIGLGDSPPRHVLHIHGFHSAPDRLILGMRAFEDAYGHVVTQPDEYLRTLPRKVLWTLLAMRPVLFVGFGMQDPFFNAVLDLLKSDFLLTDEPAHLVITHYDVDPATVGILEPHVAHEEAMKKIREKLPPGVVPIFYHAPIGPDGLANHSELVSLIGDIAGRLGRRPGNDTVDRLTQRSLAHPASGRATCSRCTFAAPSSRGAGVFWCSSIATRFGVMSSCARPSLSTAIFWTYFATTRARRPRPLDC
jgi:hypothetical protein